MNTNTGSRGGLAVAAVCGVVLCITVFGAILCFTSGSILNGSGSLITGIGNSGNRFNPDPPEGRLADLIVDREIASTIADDVLTEVYDAVLTNAKQGDADAALVIFEIANRQRKMPVEAEAEVESAESAESSIPSPAE